MTICIEHSEVNILSLSHAETDGRIFIQKLKDGNRIFLNGRYILWHEHVTSNKLSNKVHLSELL